ncbi:MAG: MarR family transcriptional regulator [Gemmatimonadetes bacterium]|nr:MarR family transcriptional regulator [Gemmatimonadota bacterium]
MPVRKSQSPPRRDLAVADRLHTAAIRLLRRLRAEDRAMGLSGPRASALSVVVFAGPISLGALARAEQVRAPTMTRLVQGLERQGLVRRVRDGRDGRVQLIRATEKGRRLLAEGRARRVARLAEGLRQLPAAERAVLREAAELLQRLTLTPV